MEYLINNNENITFFKIDKIDYSGYNFKGPQFLRDSV